MSDSRNKPGGSTDAQRVWLIVKENYWNIDCWTGVATEEAYTIYFKAYAIYFKGEGEVKKNPWKYLCASSLCKRTLNKRINAQSRTKATAFSIEVNGLAHNTNIKIEQINLLISLKSLKQQLILMLHLEPSGHRYWRKAAELWRTDEGLAGREGSGMHFSHAVTGKWVKSCKLLTEPTAMTLTSHMVRLSIHPVPCLTVAGSKCLGKTGQNNSDHTDSKILQQSEGAEFKLCLCLSLTALSRFFFHNLFQHFWKVSFC